MFDIFRINDVLELQTQNLWDASLSKGTKQTYKSAIQSFIQFMNFHYIPCSVSKLPDITEDHLIYFVTYCQSVKNLKHDTIKLYLAGIRFHYLRAGRSDPTLTAERLSYVLRGIKKSQNNVTNDRLPITADILRLLCNLLVVGVFSPFIDLMLHAAFLTAFFGFLRCGEFTRKAKNNCYECLLISDIILIDNNQYIIKLRSSKTDPFRKGVNISIFENDNFNPVKNMFKYVSTRFSMGATQNSPLFVENEFENSALTRDTFISLLRQMLSRIGCHDDKYCGHSFRIGAATSAAAAGVEDHIIQTLGRWSSDCFTRYIRTDKNVIGEAQNKMCLNAL